MYCPRCNIETGEDSFCENCGGATVASSEVAATAAVQASIPQPIQEEIKADKIKITTPKFSVKKIASIIGVLVIVIGFFAGYNTLKDQYTPRETVNKYYNYLSKQDYDNAYKLLTDTDDNFLTKDTFKKAMENFSFKSYSIRNYNPNEYGFDTPKGNSLNSLGNMFSVQAGGKLYPVEVVKEGKKFVFFDNYKINADCFATKWDFTAPKGAKISINGKEPSISNQPNLSNVYDGGLLMGVNYKTTRSAYVIDKIFTGSYDITATMEGAKDVKISGAVAGKKIDIPFEPKQELANQLQDMSKKFLDLYYSKAAQDQYSALLTPDSKVATKIFQFGAPSDKVTNKLQDIKVTYKSIDDINHAKITVTGTVNYEDSSLVSFGFNKQTGTKNITVDFYFEKQNDKWLIVDTGYIN